MEPWTCLKDPFGSFVDSDRSFVYIASKAHDQYFWGTFHMRWSRFEASYEDTEAMISRPRHDKHFDLLSVRLQNRISVKLTTELDFDININCPPLK